jgi:glycosyltransferase involved in cell wall biosynthesis
MQNVLFIHQNFPGQFVHLASHLAARSNVQVAAIGAHYAQELPGVRLVKYQSNEADVPSGHAFARQFNIDCQRGEQVVYACLNLMGSGFVPDVVYAHPGWGESLPLRSLFPDARILAYCELYYRRDGQDRNFDPEFPQTDVESRISLHLRNASFLLALDDCDAGISPIHWQQQSFPAEFRPKIQVIHDGVDTDLLRPDDAASFALPSGQRLTRADEVFTFATRSHEPLRGYHIFMRALPKILQARPNAKVLIIGGEGDGYGFRAPPARDWKKLFLDQVAPHTDASRVHSIGQLPHADYVRALQISRARIYLTYPFVLSWSLIEAMSAACLVIGSNTPPVREVIDGANGLLVDFLDVGALADRVIDALADPARFEHIRQRARATALERYDLKCVCLPALLEQMGLEPGPAG